MFLLVKGLQMLAGQYPTVTTSVFHHCLPLQIRVVLHHLYRYIKSILSM